MGSIVCMQQHFVCHAGVCSFIKEGKGGHSLMLSLFRVCPVTLPLTCLMGTLPGSRTQASYLSHVHPAWLKDTGLLYVQCAPCLLQRHRPPVCPMCTLPGSKTQASYMSDVHPAWFKDTGLESIVYNALTAVGILLHK